MKCLIPPYFLWSILWLIYLPISPVKGQNLGIPFIDSYSKEAYGYGTQNWKIDQDDQGVLYFANNDGMLVFDGSEWELFPLPNRTICRSLLVSGEEIYVGGQNEFGKFVPDEHSRWAYQSLRDQIPEIRRDFEDVWEIVEERGVIYFRSGGKIFVFKDEEVTVIEDKTYIFLGKTAGRVYVQDKRGVLYTLSGTQAKPLIDNERLRNTEVKDIAIFGDSLLISTLKHGLLLLTGAQVKPWPAGLGLSLQELQINTTSRLRNGDWAIGTSFGGVVILNDQGRLKHHLSKAQGLFNNKVIYTYADRNDNLWCGLDHGISFIQTNFPFTQIRPDGELEGIGYDVRIFQGKIYFGTSNGIYYTDWDKSAVNPSYQLIPNTAGQVWGLDIIDDKLLLSHMDGGFLIDGGSADPIFKDEGVWLFQQHPEDKKKVIAGTYTGLSVFSLPDFRQQADLKDFHESSRFIEVDAAGNYWIAHPYRGIYRVDNLLDSSLTSIGFFGEASGLDSDLHNHVFKIGGQLLFCSQKQVYTYDYSTDTFVPYSEINDYLAPNIKVRRLFESDHSDIWFVTNQEVGFLQVEEKGLSRSIRKYVFPELKKLMNGGWEMIYPYEPENVFIATINGFLHFNGKAFRDSPNRFDIILKEIVVDTDSSLYAFDTTELPPGEERQLPLFRYRQNSLIFKVQATDFVNNESLKFQYWLEGQDADWSSPTELRSKEYTNLQPGIYQLKVRAIDLYGNISPTLSYSFEIDRPWYRSYLFQFLCLLLVMGVGAFIYINNSKKYKELEQRFDSTIQQSQEEIERLEKEKMQVQIEHKNRELVSATLHLLKKNETITQIAEDLKGLKQHATDPGLKSQINKLMRRLKMEETVDEGWEQLMYHFNEIHKGYFDRLKAAYPSITPKDLKMCAYLKMNLSTKEMATLMNISIRGVEASRYRLRKKLELDSEVNLNEFLMSF